MNSKVRCGLAAALVALATSCGAGVPAGEVPDAGADGPGGTAPSLELGTGRDRFVALADGDAVDVIFGPQGGYHIWGSLRTSGLDPTDVQVTYRVLMNDLLLSENPYELDLQRAGSRAQWVGLIGLVPDPEAVYGRPVQLTITARDRNGVTATDSRTVVPRRAP